MIKKNPQNDLPHIFSVFHHISSFSFEFLYLAVQRETNGQVGSYGLLHRIFVKLQHSAVRFFSLHTQR